MSEVAEQVPHTNGVDLNDDDEHNKSRPADIEAVSYMTNKNLGHSIGPSR